MSKRDEERKQAAQFIGRSIMDGRTVPIAFRRNKAGQVLVIVYDFDEKPGRHLEESEIFTTIGADVDQVMAALLPELARLLKEGRPILIAPLLEQ